jgi:hypothetical protein
LGSKSTDWQGVGQGDVYEFMNTINDRAILADAQASTDFSNLVNVATTNQAQLIALNNANEDSIKGANDVDLTDVKLTQENMMDALLTVLEELILRSRWTTDNVQHLADAMGAGYVNNQPYNGVVIDEAQMFN